MTVSTLAPADTYNDFQRYQLAAGKLVKFHPPPTPHYKITTTAASVGAKGTLVELQPISAASSGEEWDTYANQPLYAARYENPLVKQESRTIYWEVELPASLDDDDDEGAKKGELAMGFCVKDDARLGTMREAASSGHDPRLHPTPETKITVGPSLLVNVATGEVFADGEKVPVQRPLREAARTVGMGVTFAFNPADATPDDEKDAKKRNAFKAWVDKHSTPPVPQADPEHLRPVPVAVFLAVDGECVGVDISNVDMVAAGFDGTRDVFPALLARGGGLTATLKLGECVGWTGAGGTGDARIKGLGNKAKEGFKEPRWPFKSSDTYGWWAMS